MGEVNREVVLQQLEITFKKRKSRVYLKHISLEDFFKE